MINFIICDDNNMYVEKIKNIVENYMMNFDIECKYHLFEDYDPKFEHEMENYLDSIYVFLISKQKLALV